MRMYKTADEARTAKDSIVRLAQKMCDLFGQERKGLEFEEVMLIIREAELNGYKNAGNDILKKL